MRTPVVLSIIVLATSLVGCDKKSDPGSAGPTAEVPAATVSAGAGSSARPAGPVTRLDFPGTEEGAKALLEGFLKAGADRTTMTRSLRPAHEDYEAIFTADVLTDVKAKYEEQWGKEEYVVEAREGQTELQLWKATTEQLRDGSGDASQFPGGYKKIADKLKPGLTFYRFKFVQPGDKHGMAYDGLVFVNGHWVMVSKPYRAL